MDRTITTTNLFTDISAAELFTEMMKTFIMDMMVERQQLMVDRKKGSDEFSPEQIEEGIKAYTDILEASGLILMDVNKYRANPETKVEMALDMAFSDD